jgi:hypothetical protein
MQEPPPGRQAAVLQIRDLSGFELIARSALDQPLWKPCVGVNRRCILTFALVEKRRTF